MGLTTLIPEITNQVFSRKQSQPQQQTTPTTTTKTTPTNITKPQSFHADKDEALLAEATSHIVKDPTIFKDPRQKYAAILSRAQRIQSNPKFQALPDERKQKVLANYYKRYVKPGYEQTGQKAPDEAVWLAGVKHLDRFKPSDYFESGFSENMAQMGMSMNKGLLGLPAGMLMAGSYLTKAEALAALGIDKMLPNAHKDDWFQHLAKDDMSGSAQMKHYAEKVNHSFDSNINFWQETHPTSTLTNKLMSGAGDIVGTLPLYEALGAAALSTKLVKGASDVALSPTVSAKLAQTAAGKFVAKRLIEGADGFISSVLTQDKDNATKNAILFAGFAAGSEAVGGTVKAGSSLIKKFSARVATQGGVVLADALTHEAAHELDHVVATDKPLEAIAAAEAADPVKAKLLMAEKTAINSTAIEKYGKVWIKLPNGQKARVIAARLQASRDAVLELPIHEPEVARAQAHQETKAAEAENFFLKQRNAEFEAKFGISVPDAMHEAEVSRTKDISGTRSSQAASRKSAKAAKKVLQLNADNEAAGSAARVVEKTPRAERAAIAESEPEIKMQGTPEAKRTEPDRYVQFKVQTLAYFKQKAAESGSDKALSRFLRDLSPEDLHKELSEALGVEKVFERPDHLLLYANHFRDQLPKPYQIKIAKFLRDEADLTLGLPRKTIDQMSDNLERHMDRLSYVGRLWSGEKFFRSTKVGTWANMTKWQRELHVENAAMEVQNYTKMTEAFRANFPKEVNLGLKMLTRMQAERKKVQDAILDRQKTEEIRQLGRTIASKLEGRAQ